MPESLIIPFVLIGISVGKGAHRSVARVPGAERGPDRARVPWACVSTSEGPAAQLAVAAEGVRVEHVDGSRALAVPQLANVEVAVDAGDPLGWPDPPQHDVACRLHQSLALHHALAVVRELAAPEIRLQHRRLGLLPLQEQRVAVIVAGHQHYPGPRA